MLGVEEYYVHKKLIVPAAVSLVAVLTVVLAALGVNWWAVPGILTLLGVSVRVVQVVERTSRVVATLRRNEGRVRVIDKDRHAELLRLVQATATDVPTTLVNTVGQASVAARSDEMTPRPARPGAESLKGSPRAEFRMELPHGAESVELWLEVGSFDLLSGEMSVEIAVDGVSVRKGVMNAHPRDSLLALGTISLEFANHVDVVVLNSKGTATGLPPGLAFRAMVGVLAHPLLPRSSVRTFPMSALEADHD